MAKRGRQLVLMRQGPPGAMPPLGTLREVRTKLAAYNTAPDGGPGKAGGTEILYGPGLVIEVPTTLDSVTQAIVTMQDEDIAWPVLARLCKALGWTMMDMETGRMFSG